MLVMQNSIGYRISAALACGIACLCSDYAAAADWPQLQGNARRTGNVPQEVLAESLGLRAAVPLTDAILASPIVSDGQLFVIDG